MKKQPPPPPPSFELPSEDPTDSWNQLTDEDHEFLKQAEREGRLPNWTLDQALAEIEVARKKFNDRLRRAGFDPDGNDDSAKK